jgi:TolA-binding protein
MLKPLAISFAAAFVLAGCAGTGSSAPSSRTAASTESQDLQTEAPRIVSTAEFLSFLDTLETDIGNGEPREMTRLEKRRVGELSDELRGMLAGVDQVDQLNSNLQTQIYNKTQELWTAVIGRAEDQVVCRREHRVGTNFKTTRCRTIEQIREDQRTADQYLRGGRAPGPMPVRN